MEKQNLQELGSEISALILKHITDLEKDLEQNCADFGKLDSQEKARLIDEWLFFCLFRVDLLLFKYFQPEERVTLKEELLHAVFAPLRQVYERDYVIEVMKLSVERFTEYAEEFKKEGRHLQIYPLVRKHLAEINPLILKGSDSPKNAIYSFLVQKNVEGRLVSEVRAAIEKHV